MRTGLREKPCRLSCPRAASPLREALRCDAGEWGAALQDLEEFYRQFGARLPREIDEKLTETRRRFGI